MCRKFLYALTVGMFVSPVWAQPRQWVDDFKTAITYDSNWIYSGCSGGSPAKYSLLEGLLGDTMTQHAWTGDGSFTFTGKGDHGLMPSVGRKDFALLGWLGVLVCSGSPPIGESTEPFTSGDICIYGGKTFNSWQCELAIRNSWNIFGDPEDPYFGDDQPGVAGVDDDHNGVTDNWEESPAARPTTVNNGWGNKNGTGFQAGWDNAPGVSGVDDDGNGIVDDVGETGWTGSDDGDDTQRMMHWVCLKTNVHDVKLFYLDFDAGSGGDAFSIREIIGTGSYMVQWADEITSFDYFNPGIVYNWVFCVAGHSCYGAMMWHNADMANPVETLGPAINTRHTGPRDQLIGFGYDAYSPDYPKVQFQRQVKMQGNTNFSDTFWVCSGPSSTYYPSPSADLDGDKDVDGFDFLTFSNCYNGSNKAPLAACANTRSDLDRDGDVDGFDFLTFSNCYNGSNRKPLAACFPPNLTTCSPPDNDTCATAQAVTEGSTVGEITPSCSDDIACPSDEGGRDVWFVYTPTATGTITISTCDRTGLTTYLDDAELTVRSGTCGGAALVGPCSDGDLCTGDAERMETVSNVPVSAGVPVYIAVQGEDASDKGQFILTISVP